MRRDEVRSQILQTAGGIFATEGFGSATIRRICSQAGVNVAAVNYYFGDKVGLYVEALKHARTLIEQRWPLPETGLDQPAAVRLHVFVQTLCRRVLSPQTTDWPMRLLLREIVEPTTAGEDLVREGFQPFFEALLDILRLLVPEDVPPAKLQQIGFSIIGQCLFYRVHQRAVRLMVSEHDQAEYFSADELARHVLDFSMAAICQMQAEAKAMSSESTGNS